MDENNPLVGSGDPNAPTLDLSTNPLIPGVVSQPMTSGVGSPVTGPSAGVASALPSLPPLPSKEVGPTPGNLSDEQAKKLVLNRIASGEAPDYNVLFGGRTFDNYAWHPNVAMIVPGQYHDDGSPVITHAAGRYQFQYTTWANEAKKLGLTDFSPESQDKAAWDLAQRTYGRETGGRNLLQDAKMGNVQWNAMAGEWPSLSKGQGPWSQVGTKSASQGSRTSGGSVGLEDGGIPGSGARNAGLSNEQGSPTGSVLGDNLLNMERELLPLRLLQALGQSQGVKFHPVDYNPMQIAQAMKV